MIPDRNKTIRVMLALQRRRIGLTAFMLDLRRMPSARRLMLTPLLAVHYLRLCWALAAAERLLKPPG